MADLLQTSWSETDSNNNAAAPDGFPEGMAPSGVNDAARAMMGALKRRGDLLNPMYTTTGAANAQTVAVGAAEAQYYAGARYCVKVGVGLTNTGAATINIGSLGAKAIKDVYGNALVGGELQAGGYAEFIYDGTNMVLLSTARWLGPQLIWKKSISSGDPSCDFTPLPTFDRFDLNLYGVTNFTDNVDLNLRVSTSGVFQTSNYNWVKNLLEGGGPSNQSNAGPSDNKIGLGNNIGNTSGRHVNGVATCFNPSQSSTPKFFHWSLNYLTNGGTCHLATGMGAYAGSSAAIDGIRILPGSGNLGGGVAVLVGWKFS